MKSPDACSDLGDVRNAIDAIDKEIIELLGRRLDYVLAAAQFKPTEESIAAPERVAVMLVARQAWATAYGLSETFVAALFSQITKWYIEKQTAYWRQTQGRREGDT